MNETTDKHILPYLSTISTADLVAELNRRGGCPVNCPTIDETSTAPVCLPVIPTAPLVNELCSREGVMCINTVENTSYEAYITNEYDEITDCVHGFYPDRIIVVRGE